MGSANSAGIVKADGRDTCEHKLGGCASHYIRIQAYTCQSFSVTDGNVVHANVERYCEHHERKV